MNNSKMLVVGFAAVVAGLVALDARHVIVIKLRRVKNNIAARNMNVRLVGDIEKLDALSEREGALFYEKHKPLFETVAGDLGYDVEHREAFMELSKRTCGLALYMLMLEDLYRRYSKRAHSAKQEMHCLDSASEVQQDRIKAFVHLREKGFPTELIIDYARNL